MPKTDAAHLQTEQMLQELELRIAFVYEVAAQEMQGRIQSYFAQFAQRDAVERAHRDEGDISDAQYQQWRLAQIGRGQRFSALRDVLASRMTRANEVAASYINDATPGIYALNRNFAAYTVEKSAGNLGFALWDEQTVRRLLVEQPNLMPHYPPEQAVRRGIDLAWGKQQITAQVTSSILQGENLRQIRESLQRRIPEMNRTSAVCAARTATTSAQNAGRQDVYKAANEMGIVVRKRWMATKDERTRLSHGLADGQTVRWDAAFQVDGAALLYPGDPAGPPRLVYNCRCTMCTVEKDGIEGEPRMMRVRDPVTGKNALVEEMTWEKWQEWKRYETVLEKNRESVILNSSEFHNVPVTLQSIDRIRPFDCRVLNKTEQAALAEAHKELLREAAGQPLGTEVARVYGLKLQPIGGYTYGKEGRVRITDPNVPYIAMHTHPSGLEFSSIDIQKFAMHRNMVMLTAVGNNGRVFALERKSDCDNDMVSFLVQQLTKKEQNAIQKTEVIQHLRNFYKEAKRYGIEYYS